MTRRWEAVRAGFYDLLDANFASVEESVVIRTQHNNILEVVRPTVLTGHDMCDIAGGLAPSADCTTVDELISNPLPESGRFGVFLHISAPCHDRAMGDSLAFHGAVFGAWASGRIVLKYLSAYFARLGRFTIFKAGWIDALVSVLAQVSAELGGCFCSPSEPARDWCSAFDTRGQHADSIRKEW